jgi:hypothetical protein
VGRDGDPRARRVRRSRTNYDHFAEGKFGEPLWVVLALVNVLDDYDGQLPSRLVVAVDPLCPLANFVECGGHGRKCFGIIHSLGFGQVQHHTYSVSCLFRDRASSRPRH